MSAFICEDGQFEAAVNGWVTHIQRNPGLQRMADIANLLKRENIRSVNWRYNERTKFKPVDFTAKVSNASIWQVIQWLKCIDYQSCERNDYEKSEAYRTNLAMQAELFSVACDHQFNNTSWSV